MAGHERATVWARPLARPDDESNTAGGLVLTLIGRLPVAGDEIAIEGYDVRVEKLAGKRIQRLHFRPRRPEPVGCDAVAPGAQD